MKDPRSVENNIVRLILVGAFLLFAYFAVQVFSGIYTNKLAEKLSGPQQEMQNQYAKQIGSQTDAYAATKLGTQFLKAQNNDLALLSFQKATDLDAGYRDGWVWRGYTELKTSQPAEALKSLKRAEGIDPINPKTYELLTVAYQANGDEENAKAAQAKYEYLKKTSP